jgi:hypothetical protein
VSKVPLSPIVDTVAVSAVETRFTARQVSASTGGLMILLQISTPLGIACHLIPPSQAWALGDVLCELGAVESIILPGGEP